MSQKKIAAWPYRFKFRISTNFNSLQIFMYPSNPMNSGEKYKTFCVQLVHKHVFWMSDVLLT